MVYDCAKQIMMAAGMPQAVYRAGMGCFTGTAIAWYYAYDMRVVGVSVISALL